MSKWGVYACAKTENDTEWQANVPKLTAEFFNQMWKNADRRFELFTRWLQTRPTTSSSSIDALQDIVHILNEQPGDICAIFTSRAVQTTPGPVTRVEAPCIVGQSVSLMAGNAFTLQWEWFNAGERRFLLWLGSMNKTLFQRREQYHKGIKMDQFVHSDLVWSRSSRRLLLRDLILLCNCHEPDLGYMSYYLLVATLREQCIKNRTADCDAWFLSQMTKVLQGICGPPHEMLIESPRRVANATHLAMHL